MLRRIEGLTNITILRIQMGLVINQSDTLKKSTGWGFTRDLCHTAMCRLLPESQAEFPIEYWLFEAFHLPE